jgi:hypothetical protein
MTTVRTQTSAPRRRHRALLAGAVVALAALGATTVATAQSAKIPVRTTRAYGEYQPVRGEGYTGWEQNSRRRPNRFHAFIKRDGRVRVRLNRDGTQGAMGGMSGNTVVYQQFTKRRSNIWYYNVRTGRRSTPPIFINSRRWEYWPDISGEWVLFGRRKLSGRFRRVLLYNRVREFARLLDRTRASNAFIAPGQVNGNFAVWYRCKLERRCNVFRYNIDIGVTLQIRNRFRRDQHAPSVASDGTVYFVRGRRRCGIEARLMRFRNGRITRLLSLRRGFDIGDTYVATTPGGRNEIYFEQNRCDSAAGSDIYKIVD